ncbi:hypothetical protein TUM12370_32710 [Salmonella enterica subsp. enterica serovar Choleraesuis]|nr:hypothetical protein TUM12370_32710 [Salmonella enterica subsp. enterica serovar Choleraesuis]
MKTHSIIKSYADNADDDKLRSLLPGFYLEKDYSGRIYLYPTNTGDYIISTGKVPSFICQAE